MGQCSFRVNTVVEFFERNQNNLTKNQSNVPWEETSVNDNFVQAHVPWTKSRFNGPWEETLVNDLHTNTTLHTTMGQCSFRVNTVVEFFERNQNNLTKNQSNVPWEETSVNDNFVQAHVPWTKSRFNRPWEETFVNDLHTNTTLHKTMGQQECRAVLEWIPLWSS